MSANMYTNDDGTATGRFTALTDFQMQVKSTDPLVYQIEMIDVMKGTKLHTLTFKAAAGVGLLGNGAKMVIPAEEHPEFQLEQSTGRNYKWVLRRRVTGTPTTGPALL